METPTARFMKEGQFRFGAGQVKPYRYYYGALSPFSWMEMGGRLTEVLDVPGFAGRNEYGNYKDKAVDFKFRLFPEGKYRPALALGIMDPHGTRVYPSQYLVLSKQIYPFDFSVGFGNGRFGKRALPTQGEGVKLEILQEPNTWRTDGQFFGGVQFALSEKLSLMAEYNPIQYEKQTNDPARRKYFQEAVPSRFNFGLRWKPLDWLEADISYQRGNEIGVNLSMNFELGVPMLPLYEKIYIESPELRPGPLARRIIVALRESGFSNIGVTIGGGDLRIEAQNDQYYYMPKALAKMLSLLKDILDRGEGRDISDVHILLSDNGIPVLAFDTTREDIALLYEEKYTLGEFLYASKTRTDVTENLPVRHADKRWWNWGLKPSLQTMLNDPSGFFKYRFGAEGWGSLNPWRGSSFVLGLEGYALNNVSSSNIPPDQAVQSDLWLYKKENVNMSRLFAEQIEKFPYEIYGRVAAGYLEVQYGGVDAEVAKPFFDGRLLVGLSGSTVKKREVGSLLQYKDRDYKSWYQTAFLNTRINFPELESALDLKTGQFLAGDRGTVITVSKFFNGIVLYGWYSFTDTDLFRDVHNRGYHDKGIAIAIPLRLFKGSDSRTSYYFGLSPWTRDVAQDINHHNTLFDHIGRKTKVFLNRDTPRSW